MLRILRARPLLASRNLTAACSQASNEPVLPQGQFGLPWNEQKLRKFSTPVEQHLPNEKPKNNRAVPRLMAIPEILWPSAFKSLRNWIMTTFVIRPYFDAEFNIKDFIRGAKQACQTISYKLANGDFDALQGLVTAEAIQELKPIVQNLSVSQRHRLEVKAMDIYMSFPYQIGVMFDDSDDAKTQKRWVEITMVFHTLNGFHELQRNPDGLPWNMHTLPEFQKKIFVCNYRFKKEFTNGNQSDWTVNAINHFNPGDVVGELAP